MAKNIGVSWIDSKYLAFVIRLARGSAGDSVERLRVGEAPITAIDFGLSNVDKEFSKRFAPQLSPPDALKFKSKLSDNWSPARGLVVDQRCESICADVI